MTKADKRAAKEAKRQARAQRLAAEPVPIFFVQPTGREFHERGYRCANGHYHWVEAEERTIGREPVQCPKCELMADGWSARTISEYGDASGNLYRGEGSLPPGACWEGHRHDGKYHNWISKKHILSRPNKQDGRVLVVMLPDGHPWVIDSRANNCTLPDDDKHWCWNRSGRPEDGTLDVRKGKPGHRTCSAGGGSIATSRYHGFLHDGKLRAC